MLLPSKELAELSKRVDICLSGRTAPAGCDIRYRQLYWLLTFDAKGELKAACKLADRLGKLTKQGMSVPEAVVALVEEGLAESKSLEQLERDYVAAAGSEAAYKALRAKLTAMDGVGQMRIAGFLAEVADKTKDPVLSRERSLRLEVDACNHQVINHAAFGKLRQRMARHFTDHPGAASEELVAAFVGTALKYTFDIEARCRAYADAWSADAKLAKLLVRECDAAVERGRKELQGMKPGDYGRLRLIARLGDAKAILAGLDATKSFGVMRPIHAEWRKEATAKLGAGSPPGGDSERVR